MSFRVGETVVHPHHGAAVVDEIERRSFGGQDLDYIVLSSSHNGLTLRVPVEKADEIGLRPCISRTQVTHIMDVLSDDPSPVKGHWSRRLKQNQQRLRSGDLEQVAQVLRDLSAKDTEKGLSPAEKRLRDNARRMIDAELSAVVKGGEAKAVSLVDEALGLEPAA